MSINQPPFNKSRLKTLIFGVEIAGGVPASDPTIQDEPGIDCQQLHFRKSTKGSFRDARGNAPQGGTSRELRRMFARVEARKGAK